MEHASIDVLHETFSVWPGRVGRLGSEPLAQALPAGSRVARARLGLRAPGGETLQAPSEKWREPSVQSAADDGRQFFLFYCVEHDSMIETFC